MFISGYHNNSRQYSSFRAAPPPPPPLPAAASSQKADLAGSPESTLLSSPPPPPPTPTASTTPNSPYHLRRQIKASVVKKVGGTTAHTTPKSFTNAATDRTAALGNCLDRSIGSAVGYDQKNVVNFCRRQQPFRSSFCCSARNNHQRVEIPKATSAAGVNGIRGVPKTTISNGCATPIKPLTPKLLKRIETTCSKNPPNKCKTQENQVACFKNNSCLRSTNKITAVEPQSQSSILLKSKTNGVAVTPARTFSSTTNRLIMELDMNANTGQINGKNLRAGKSLVNGGNNAAIIKSTKENALDEQKRSHQAAVLKFAKTANKVPFKQTDTKPSSLTNSPCLNHRRFISTVGVNSFNVLCNGKLSPAVRRKSYAPPSVPEVVNLLAAGTNTNTEVSNKSRNPGKFTHNSNAEQNSSKTRKAFSNKFPKGLPFEKEFYRRNYSSFSDFSSSSQSPGSNESKETTVSVRNDVGGEANGLQCRDTVADEFHRNPSLDKTLYVDFSKVVFKTVPDSKLNSHNIKCFHSGNRKDFCDRLPTKDRTPNDINSYYKHKNIINNNNQKSTSKIRYTISDYLYGNGNDGDDDDDGGVVKVDKSYLHRPKSCDRKSKISPKIPPLLLKSHTKPLSVETANSVKSPKSPLHVSSSSNDIASSSVNHGIPERNMKVYDVEKGPNDMITKQLYEVLAENVKSTKLEKKTR